MTVIKTEKSYFDQVLDFLEVYLPSACGSLCMVGIMQYYLPQPPSMYFLMAGIALVISIFLTISKTIAKGHYGR